jgi:hypothetical protein
MSLTQKNFWPKAPSILLNGVEIYSPVMQTERKNVTEKNKEGQDIKMAQK